MTSTRTLLRRRRGQLQSFGRGLRYRFIVPVVRSPHSPEHTARGVANGVFWALTPTFGFQTLEILLTWLVARKGFGKDSSLIQAFLWVWINNPLTMLPMCYGFYVTGLWLLGDAGGAQGYDAFQALWAHDATGWFGRMGALVRAIGVPTVIGSIPYAALGGLISYRLALSVVRRRKEKIRSRLAVAIK